MSEELRLCPFCNGKAIFVRDPEDVAEITGIYCLACKAYVKWNIQPGKRETFGETQSRWTEKWNRRAESCKQS